MQQKLINNRLYSTLVENSLQINLFMQNKPNFRKAKMNVNIYHTKIYQNETAFRRVKNKPNSNPIKPNLKRAKINANDFITKDYRKKDYFVVRINKPNFQNGQNDRKRIFYRGLRQCYRLPAQKNKPNSNPIYSQAKIASQKIRPHPGKGLDLFSS